jgi:cell division protease FtsH
MKSNRPNNPLRVCHTRTMSKKIIWTVLVLAACVFSYVSLSDSENRVEIQIVDLWKLVDQGPPQLNPKAAVDVREGPDDNEITYRYSQLDNIRIGQSEITGTVKREIIRPQSLRTKPETKVGFHTPRFGLENYSNAIFDLLIKKGFTNVRAEQAPSIWYNMLPMLVSMIPILLVILYMMRRQGGAGLVAAFSRSRGKLFVQKDIDVTFDDVAGIDEAVDELREVVDFLKSPKKYQILGGRIPKGLLLVGSTGTGKTLLARAVAGEAGVPFFSLSGSDFVEMFAGVGAARVRDMFKQAQAKAPCIVFIDELDSLGKIRGNVIESTHDEREQTLNALLAEMDGFIANSGVIIMAATNRPNMLDPALLRPGRFDRHVLVDRPDMNGREQILRVHVKKVNIDKSVDVKAIAKMTSGFVGADLANLVNEAALLTARANKQAITMAEFTEGVERLTSGLEKRQRVMRAEEKIRFAYHESAHALAAYYLPDAEPVRKVSIIPRGLVALDYASQRPEGDHYLLTLVQLQARIQVLLAGSMAEEMVFHYGSTSAKNDLERATEIARSMIMDYGLSRLGRISYRESNTSYLSNKENSAGERNHSEQTAREIDEEIRYIINQAMEKVGQSLEVHRRELVAITERLIEKEVIDVAELTELIQSKSASKSAPKSESRPESKSPCPAIAPGATEATTGGILPMAST